MHLLYLPEQSLGRLKGAESRWYPYLQSLSAAIVPIARLWGDTSAFPDDADSQEASLWIHGTEIQKELQDEEGNLLMVMLLLSGPLRMSLIRAAG